eukprot:CAMPEP_0115852800 /NCGR_PEP_ID=MMETSP0287-20121206/13180_1 /TAXON_ID=412157 /ORGANISM="Chrysochromulina rotalis, Strain UIO044" /LENGTH=158 /DNA_ID=CAMNT_0003306867 /DNA_START=184 /DNA_END=661 /DNA_ORIENTATION=+
MPTIAKKQEVLNSALRVRIDDDPPQPLRWTNDPLGPLSAVWPLLQSRGASAFCIDESNLFALAVQYNQRRNTRTTATPEFADLGARPHLVLELQCIPPGAVKLAIGMSSAPARFKASATERSDDTMTHSTGLPDASASLRNAFKAGSKEVHIGHQPAV